MSESGASHGDKDEYEGRFDRVQNTRDNDEAKPSSSCRVYVTNIPPEYRWQDLKDLFRSRVGEVRFAKVFLDEAGAANGSGIVQFADPAAVPKCIEEMQGFDLKGCQLNVTDDVPEIDCDPPKKRARLERNTDTSRGVRGGSSSNRVYVSNLPHEFRWQDLKDLFRDEVGEVLFAKVLLDEMNNLKRCGIVEFCDREMVDKCLQKMHGFEVNGRTLIVKEDGSNTRNRHGHMSGDVEGNRFGSSLNNFNDGGNGSCGDMYGLSQSFLQSLNINGPLCSRVFVANLDYKVDKKKLKEVFRLAGRVLRVDLHTYEDGRSKGYAVVEYDHPVESVQAISMLHGQFLFDRRMMVRMDQNVQKLPEGLRSIGVGLGLNGECLKDVVHNLPSLSSGGNQQTTPNQALQVSNFLTGMNTVAGNATLSSLISSQSALQATLSGLLVPGSGLGVAKDLLQVTRDTMNNLSKALVPGLLSQNALFTANQNAGSRQPSNFNQSDSPAFERANHLHREGLSNSGTNAHFATNSRFAFGRGNQSMSSNQNVNAGSVRNSDFVSR